MIGVFVYNCLFMVAKSALTFESPTTYCIFNFVFRHKPKFLIKEVEVGEYPIYLLRDSVIVHPSRERELRALGSGAGL